MNDNQYITKTDLKIFGKELVVEIKKELEDRLENKFQLMREEIRRENSVSFQEMRKENKLFYNEIKKDNATYYGLVHEDLKDTFKANRQWLMDVPERVSKLSTKSEENDEEHTDFRARLRLLEQG